MTCSRCGYWPDLHDDMPDHRPPPWAVHLTHLIEGIDRIMTDFVQAEADAEAEITTLLTELIAAVKAASHVDPAVQAAADKLEAFVASTKTADPTPVEAPAPVVEPVSTPVDTPAPDADPVADPTPVDPAPETPAV